MSKRLIDYDEAYAKAHDLVHRGKLEWEEFSDIINFLDSMQIIDAEAVQRWIPVTERLPTKEDADRFGRVFAVDKDKRMNDTNWRVVNWYPETFSHWMPLPDAPKDGE